MNDMKENDFEKFEALLQGKSYGELTPAEWKFVNQWVESEEEYQALRSSAQQTATWFKVNPVSAPGNEVLAKLRRTLKKEKHSRVVAFAVKPIWGYAATALLFGGLGWWIGQPASTPVQKPIVEQVLVRDTVYMTVKPDTIFVERVVYREPGILAKSPVKPEVQKDIRGVSMKEKEELDKLLVSGTE